ncbi:MAG: DUF448 domain-containing protein [Erythrobacter sp.]
MRTPTNERLTPDIADSPRPRKSEPDTACAHSKGEEAAAERRCILSGESVERGDLLRLAISPEDADGVAAILPDPAAKAPGRGAWIKLDQAALETALASGQFKGALARAFKGAKLSYSENLPQLARQALQRAVTDRLGLELRSGNLVMGSGRIDDQARSGRVQSLFHASDSSEDGRKRLDQAWRVGRDEEGSGARGLVLPLDRASLSVALGRDNVVHLAICDPGAAKRVSQVLDRFCKFVGWNEDSFSASGARPTGPPAD